MFGQLSWLWHCQNCKVGLVRCCWCLPLLLCLSEPLQSASNLCTCTLGLASDLIDSATVAGLWGPTDRVFGYSSSVAGLCVLFVLKKQVFIQTLDQSMFIFVLHMFSLFCLLCDWPCNTWHTSSQY